MSRVCPACGAPVVPAGGGMFAPPSLQQAVADGSMSSLGCTGFRAHWRCTAYNWWSNSGSPEAAAHQWRDDDPSEYEAAVAALLDQYAHLDQEL